MPRSLRTYRSFSRGAWAWVLGVGHASTVRAYDASVDASFALQYYSVASPFGEPVLSRRRYTSTLGLELDDLQGASDPREPALGFRSRLRVDADFGVEFPEREPSSRR